MCFIIRAYPGCSVINIPQNLDAIIPFSNCTFSILPLEYFFKVNDGSNKGLSQSTIDNLEHAQTNVQGLTVSKIAVLEGVLE